MTLCLDVGNTTVHGGIFDGNDLIVQFRKTSVAHPSSDESGVFLRTVLKENGVDPESITQIGICSVVPDAIYSLRSACLKYFNITPFELGPGVKTGLKINYRNPLEVGADRIANAVAAVNQFPGKNLIIIDFGTATTFDVVSKNKVYEGGVILPGLQLSMEALEQKTAKLPQVEIVQRNHAVGRSTMGSIQSGLYYGQIGTVKEITQKITEEKFKDAPPMVVATGGFSSLFRETKLFDVIVTDLVLQGLRLALMANTKDMYETHFA